MYGWNNIEHWKKNYILQYRRWNSLHKISSCVSHSRLKPKKPIICRCTLFCIFCFGILGFHNASFDYFLYLIINLNCISISIWVQVRRIIISIPNINVFSVHFIWQTYVLQIYSMLVVFDDGKYSNYFSFFSTFSLTCEKNKIYIFEFLWLILISNVEKWNNNHI